MGRRVEPIAQIPKGAALRTCLVAFALGLVLGAAVVSGCGPANGAKSGNESEEAQRAGQEPRSGVDADGDGERGDAAIAAPEAVPDVPEARLESPVWSPSAREALARVLDAAIGRGDVAGAVVAIRHRGQLAALEARGSRVVGSAPEPMTPNTCFDLASLTKPLATSLAVAALVDDGDIRLDDRVRDHLTAYAAPDREAVTIADLLAHRGGLPAANALSSYDGGRPLALENAYAVPSSGVGPTVYSDVGYIVLGGLVERVAGEPLDAYVARRVYRRAGIEHLGFASQIETAACAPTELEGDAHLRGVVHDPRARKLTGVAGHAGLFGDATSVARLGDLFLYRGASPEAWVFGSDAIGQLLVDPDPKRNLALARMYGGWGHTGFTGTLLWIDAERELSVALLASRLYPDGRGDVTQLRRDVVAAAAGLSEQHPIPAPVAGIDTLAQHDFGGLRGKTVALLSHRAARDAADAATVDVLIDAPAVDVARILTPEHGIEGRKEGPVPNATYRDVPVVSLYGETTNVDPQALSGVDVLVVDLVDVGVRFYTYAATMTNALEVADKMGLRVVVLDRPNLLGGSASGPVRDPDQERFVAKLPLPLRHGLTLGEIARFAQGAKGPEVFVVPVMGWGARAPQLVGGWTPPSPNLKSREAAFLYPALGMLEFTNLSVGRGTDAPFERIGAPWLDPELLMKRLGPAWGTRVAMRAETFSPSASRFAGESCRGVRFEVTSMEDFPSVDFGFALAAALADLFPGAWDARNLDVLIAHREVTARLKNGDGLGAIALGRASVQSAKPDLERVRLYGSFF